MSPRHDHVLAAIGEVLTALGQKDANGAELATAQMMRCIFGTAAVLADERVLPLFEQAQRQAAAFHLELELELHSTAKGARAGRAYLPPGSRSAP
jgi:hypothetical protein